MEVAVHPADRAAARRAAVGVLLQERAAFQQTVAGQVVEGVGRLVAPDVAQQVLDEVEGVGRVGALHRVGARGRAGASLGRHHALQAGVHGAQQRAQARALRAGELAAVQMPSVDPGVQRVGVSADDGDRTALAVGERRGDRDPDLGEAPGGEMAALDGVGVGGVGVEMVLQEVAAPCGAHPVAPVEQPLVHRFAGEGRTGSVEG